MSADLELYYLPATEALRRFKDRSLPPVELMQAVITRAEAVKDPVNALTYTFFDEALANARKAEAKYARGGRPRPLEGLPIAIKDENNIKGKPISGGSLILNCSIPDDHIAPRRSAFSMAKSVLRDIRDWVRPC
jgi:Asp-tRNA(Asn)/Glu-tRNA(Gln) amidotransferase A subunit family amidase